MTSIEKKNKRTGMRNSLIIHALLLLFVFFYGFSTPTEKAIKPPPPVVVDFSFAPSSLSKYAKAEAGKAKPKTKEVKKIEPIKPKPVVTPKPKVPVPIKPKKPDPQPTEPIVTDAVQEEAPVEAVDEEIEVEEPEQEVLTEEDLAELEEEEAIDEPEVVEMPTTKSNESEESSDNAQDASVLDGDEGGTGKGNEGDGPGKSGGDDSTEGEGDAGDGTGVYDDSGNGVFGRRVIYRDMDAVLKNMNNTDGTIVMKFCVNRAGDVTYAEINELETTEKNRSKLKQLLKAIRNYKVEPDPKAPAEQCGKYKFKLNIQALQGN